MEYRFYKPVVAFKAMQSSEALLKFLTNHYPSLKKVLLTTIHSDSSNTYVRKAPVAVEQLDPDLFNDSSVVSIEAIVDFYDWSFIFQLHNAVSEFVDSFDLVCLVIDVDQAIQKHNNNIETFFNHIEKMIGSLPLKPIIPMRLLSISSQAESVIYKQKCQEDYKVEKVNQMFLLSKLFQSMFFT